MKTLNKKARVKSKTETSFNGIFALINIHFWKAFVGPFFAFGYPIIFILICGLIFNYPMIISSSLTIGPVAIACVSLPTAIFEFKKSTLLKRIGATNIKPLRFLLYVASYYFIIMLFSGLWTLLFAVIIFGPNYFNEGKVVYEQMIGGTQYNITLSSLKKLFGQIEIWGLIYSLFTLTLVSLAVGLFIVSVSKSILMIQAIGSTLLIISMFLTGQVFPMVAVSEVKGMWWLSYLTPFKSPITQNKMAFEGKAALSYLAQINNKEVNFGLNGTELYTVGDLEAYLESIAKYTAVSKTYPIIQGEGFASQINELLHKLNNIAGKEYTSIAFEKYNIFNVSDLYCSINTLKSYQPLIVPSEVVIQQSVAHSLEEVLNNNASAKDFITNLVISPKENGSEAKLVQDLISNVTLDTLNQNAHQLTELIMKRSEFKNLSNSYIMLASSGVTTKDLLYIGSKAENIINFILPYAWSILLIGLSAKSFRWSTR
ncbi:ABC transporter permease [Mycoplasma seminis]|uniref:ABC transporter permease n=1 Tax=Mycoplasma seminis TaxID=512749 RepID=A0ABY9H9Y5_9MOLU|nr:ABC transporter permease [Mycoplasma seminis]WLP85382.1 ABC transporter permease [Mycoplasma seminis]